MEEKNLLDGTFSMKRLSVKAKLIKDCANIFKAIEKDKEAFTGKAKRFAAKAKATIYKDYLKGVKIINKKIPVYIEMPKLKKEGNGTYSKEIPKSSDEPKEIIYEQVDLIEG